MPEKQVVFLQMACTTMRFIKRLLDAKVASVRCFSDMKPILPDRLSRLFEILKFFSPSNMEKVDPHFAFCGIIFVEQRYVAYVLNVSFHGYLYCFFDMHYSFCRAIVLDLSDFDKGNVTMGQ